MRTVQVFTVVLCVFGGLYLLTGQGFFLPDRWNPSVGILLEGLPARLLGLALLLIAAIGVVAMRTFAPGQRERRPLDWHRRYLAALLVALGLISAAFMLGQRGPTPGWQTPELSRSGRPAP